MKIFFDKLIMKNWGPFHAESVINFSHDENKPVTYIFGLNSAGKTHIYEALYWCLFNEPGIDEIKEIINKEALSNEEKEMFVRLKFVTYDDYENKSEFDVKRAIKFDSKKIESNKIVPNLIQSDFIANKFSSNTGKTKTLNQEDFKKLIDNFIPIGPRRFFFLDGEKLATLFQKENLKKIESYANALSDIHLIDRLVKNLETLYSNLIEKQPKSTGSKIIQQKERVDREQELLNQIETQRKELEDTLREAHKLESSLRRECGEYDKIKDKIDEIKDLELRRIKLNERKKSQFIQFKEDLNKDLPLLLLKREILSCIDEFEKLENEGIVPPKIPPDLLEKLLEKSNKLCICGRELDDAIKAKLKEIAEHIPDKKLNREVQDFRSLLNQYKNDLEEKSKGINKKIAAIKLLNIDINQLSNSIDEKKKFVPSDIHDNYSSIIDKFKRWTEVKEEINEKENSLTHSLNNITSRKANLRREQEKLETLYKADDRYKKIGKQVEFVRNAQEQAELIKEEVKKSIIEFVTSNTSTEFKNLIWDSQNWKEIKINNNWIIDAITSNGFTIQSDRLSQGQRHVLGIAFMSSLGKVTGNFIPFVFDSPFGRVSEEPIENIGQNLPSLMGGRQVILFVTDTEDSHIRPHIENIIGKKFVLDKLSATESIVRCS